MPNDLSRDCSSCVDLYNHVRHFEWRPVLVLNQITNQPNVVFIRLTGWIAYSCAVDKVFSASGVTETSLQLEEGLNGLIHLTHFIELEGFVPFWIIKFL